MQVPEQNQDQFIISQDSIVAIRSLCVATLPAVSRSVSGWYYWTLRLVLRQIAPAAEGRNEEMLLRNGM